MTWGPALQKLNRQTIRVFAEDLTLFGGVVIKGVRDEAHQDYDPAGFGMALSGTFPVFVCESGDVAELVKGDSVDVGSERFIVREMQPDGQGHTRVTLRQ